MSIENLWEYAVERVIDEQPLSVVIQKYREHEAQQRIELLLDQITEVMGDSEAVVSLDNILNDKRTLRKQRKERKEKQ